MKLLSTIFMFALFISSAFAQEQTLTYADAPPVLYPNPFGDGYIAGTNGYGDIGKYQRFDFTQTVSLKAVTIYLGFKQINGNPDDINVVIRSVTDSVPNQYLATVAKTLDEFAEPGAGTRIDLDVPIAIQPGTKIFVGLEWSGTADDQFAIFADENEFGDLANRSWEQYSDNTYHSFNENSSFSWGLDVDLHIDAHYVGLVSAQEPDNQVFTLSPNIPNPFVGNTNIPFTLKQGGNVQLDVFDMNGRHVSNLLNEIRSAGNHQVRFDAANLSAGHYAFRLTVNGVTATRLFTIE